MHNRQSDEPQSGAGKVVSELLGAQQAAKGMGDPDTCTGRRRTSLPLQTCMAWGNWEPAFKAQILIQSQKSWISNKISQQLNSWWDVGCFFFSWIKRKGKWGSAAQRPSGNFLFVVSIDVRVALRKAWDWSLNLRGRFETLQMGESCNITPGPKTPQICLYTSTSLLMHGGRPIEVRQTSSCS